MKEFYDDLIDGARVLLRNTLLTVALIFLGILLLALIEMKAFGATGYRSYTRKYCEWCGREDSMINRLNVHHNLPQHVRPDLANVETNLVTLCRRDHFVLGHRDNWKDWNEKLIDMVNANGRAPYNYDLGGQVVKPRAGEFE